MDKTEELSFGVFKPVGHVVISFPNGMAVDAARDALSAQGVQGPGIVRRYSDMEMLEQIDRDLQRASPLAAIGQELNLVKAHRDLAARGYHWLVVRATDDAQAVAVVACVRPFGPERAQHYGHFVITELIEHRSDAAQVAESPDLGLDTGDRKQQAAELGGADPVASMPAQHETQRASGKAFSR
jgi:hypothetical protein